MKDQNHWPHDVKVVRYLDALNAGDLEAVAALWNEASHDTELERILVEVDTALFVEESGVSGAGGANQEQRLLSSRLPAMLRRWNWAIGIGGLVVACMLAVLVWRGQGGDSLAVVPKPRHIATEVTSLPQAASAGIAAWRQSQRILEGSEVPPFIWPLPQSSLAMSSSIPPDLLD